MVNPAQVKKHFLKDHFAQGIGCRIVEVKPGYAKCTIEIGEQHLNSISTVQGGVYFTLADYTFALASNAHGNVAVAIHCDISYVKAIVPGATLTAEAMEDTLNHKIGTYTVTIRDETKETVAIFHGMAYRKKTLLNELTSA